MAVCMCPMHISKSRYTLCSSDFFFGFIGGPKSLSDSSSWYLYVYYHGCICPSFYVSDRENLGLVDVCLSSRPTCVDLGHFFDDGDALLILCIEAGVVCKHTHPDGCVVWQVDALVVGMVANQLASGSMLSTKRSGDRGQPCLTPDLSMILSVICPLMHSLVGTIE